MLHLLVVFLYSSLPLDSDIFTYFCPLWALFSLLFSVLLWGGPWKVLLLPLIESLGEAQMGAWIWELPGAHGSLWALQSCWAGWHWAPGDSQRGVQLSPCQALQLRDQEFPVEHCFLGWYCQGSPFSLSALCSLRMSLSSLASLPLSGGSRCTTTGTCLWRTWKFSSQECSNKPGKQQTDTAAGELWTWFGGRSVFLIFIGSFTCAIQVEILGTEVFLGAAALQKWEAWGISRKTRTICMQSVDGWQLQVLGWQGNMSHSKERETCQ